MRPPDLYEVVCQLSPTEMWYHLHFVPMQEAAAAQKCAAAEMLYAVHECTNQCMYKDTDTPTGNNLFLCNPSDGANKAAQVICERYALGENYGCAAAP